MKRQTDIDLSVTDLSVTFDLALPAANHRAVYSDQSESSTWSISLAEFWSVYIHVMTLITSFRTSALTTTLC